jgi:glyoxylase I family protein
MLVEWRLTDSGELQVWQDSDRAGQGLVNLAVDDLPGHRDELAGRGIVTGEIKAVNKGVQRSSVADPEGSQITLLGNFRIRY